jgi:hypothetical protein
MTARLVAKLTRRGIHLRRVGDQLEAMGLASVLTPAAVSYLREYKAVLLTALPAPLSSGTPAKVGVDVGARVAVLREAGLSPVEAERQAAGELLPMDTSAHKAARCELHACAQRQLPNSTLYRCPACLPERFVPRGAG